MDSRLNFKEHLEIVFKSSDIIYDQASDASLQRKLESIQYMMHYPQQVQYEERQKKNYQEFGFESLQQRLCYRKLFYFYRTFNPIDWFLYRGSIAI